MIATFPPKCPAIVGEPNPHKLLQDLRYTGTWAESQNTIFDDPACLYMCDDKEIYVLYVSLFWDQHRDSILDMQGVQNRQHMPDPPEGSGPNPTNDMLNLGNNQGVCKTWKQRHK